MLYHEHKTLKEATEDVEPTKPEPLKDFKHWLPSWEHWLNYISQLCGAADISLLCYVFHQKAEVEDADYNVDYANNKERYQRLTVLTGDHYMVNNKMVYNKIKGLVIDGPGWVFIKQYDSSEDG